MPAALEAGPRNRATQIAISSLLSLFIGLGAAPGLAQGGYQLTARPHPEVPGRPSSRVMSDQPGFYLATNMLIGGVSALLHTIGREDVSRRQAFLWGAAGGATVYGGQRMVGTGGAGLRFAGLQTVALGANIARNAGQGRGVTSDLVFPVYPFYVRVKEGDVALRMSARSTLGLVRVLDSPGLDGKFDWKESLLAGTPVFRSEATYLYPRARNVTAGCLTTNCPGAANGFATGGVVVYVAQTGLGQRPARDVVSHELGHVTQFTRDALLFAIPIHDAVVPELGGVGRWLDRYIVIDAILPLSQLNDAVSGFGGSRRVDNWYEREVEAMRGIRHCDRPDVHCTW